MAEEGKPSPLDREPELYEDLWPVWAAFNELHAARPCSGFGASPIPIAEIVAWLDLNGLEGDERHETYRLIRAMDDEWLTWARKQQASEKGRKEKGKDANASTGN